MSSYQELKRANPKFPILIRECKGTPAVLVARYGTSLCFALLTLLIAPFHNSCCLVDFGKEETVAIDNLDKAEISKRLEELVKKGESMPRHGNSLKFASNLRCFSQCQRMRRSAESEGAYA